MITVRIAKGAYAPTGDPSPIIAALFLRYFWLGLTALITLRIIERSMNCLFITILGKARIFHGGCADTRRHTRV